MQTRGGVFDAARAYDLKEVPMRCSQHGSKWILYSATGLRIM